MNTGTKIALGLLAAAGGFLWLFTSRTGRAVLADLPGGDALAGLFNGGTVADAADAVDAAQSKGLTSLASPKPATIVPTVVIPPANTKVQIGQVGNNITVENRYFSPSGTATTAEAIKPIADTPAPAPVLPYSAYVWTPGLPVTYQNRKSFNQQKTAAYNANKANRKK